jgi:hypothetical protein
MKNWLTLDMAITVIGWWIILGAGVIAGLNIAKWIATRKGPR